MNKIRFWVVLTALVLASQLVNFAPAQTVIGPAPGPDITFAADPTTIAKGDSSRLTWSSPTADACKEPGGWFFNDLSFGSKVVSPSSTTEYEVSCRNSSGTRADTVTVRVERCPLGNTCHGETIDIKINGSDGPVRFNSLPVTFTGEITLTSTDPRWAIFSPDPSNCVDWDSGQILHFLGFGGTTYKKEVTLLASESNYRLHIFDVECDFNIGRDSIRDSVDVIIERAGGAPTVDVDITASPMTINQGQSTTVSWTSKNATGCTGSRGGSYPTSGFFVDSPSSTRTYGMTCTGARDSATDSVTVTVAAKPVLLTFFASPSSIIRGSPSTLFWSASDATSCSASGGWSGSKSTSGSQSVSPNSTTQYTLTCTGPGDSDLEGATVTVGALVPGVTLPSVDIKGQ